MWLEIENDNQLLRNNTSEVKFPNHHILYSLTETVTSLTLLTKLPI